GAAHRHGVGLVGHRALAQRDRTGGADRGTLANGGAAGGADVGVRADGDRIGRGSIDHAVAADRGAAVGMHGGAGAVGGITRVFRVAAATDGQAVAVAQRQTVARAALHPAHARAQAAQRRIERGEGIADAVVAAALDAVGGRTEQAVAVDRGAATERGSHAVELGERVRANRGQPGVELAEVDRIGVFRTGRDVGDLAFGTRGADRDRVGAIVVRTGAERDGIVDAEVDLRARTDRGAGHATRLGIGAERGRIVRRGRGREADRRAVQDFDDVARAATRAGPVEVAAGERPGTQ